MIGNTTQGDPLFARWNSARARKGQPPGTLEEFFEARKAVARPLVTSFAMTTQGEIIPPPTKEEARLLNEQIQMPDR